MSKKYCKSLKNRGLVPIIQPEPDFSQTCGFCEILDNVELTYMKFQKILMTGCRDKGTKHQKYPICDPIMIFFKNLALSLLYPYGALTSCKN